MSALTMKVELSIVLAVEVDAPLHQFLDLFGSHPHHLLYGSTVGDIVARYHGVFDMFFEIVYSQIGDTGDPALCKRGIGFVKARLANQADLALLLPRHFQRVAHARYSCADDKEIIFVNHRLNDCFLYRLVLLPEGRSENNKHRE